MIGKLKARLILITMVSVFLLLTVLVACMNIVSYSSIVRESDLVLQSLAEQRGCIPDTADFRPDQKPGGAPDSPKDPHKEHAPMAPIIGIPSETRYFCVKIAGDGTFLGTDLSEIGTIDEETAAAYAQNAFQKGKERGFLFSFRYLRIDSGDAEHILFLDCGRQLASFETFFKVSALSALVGFAVVTLVFSFFATRIIHPIAESYEKQKRFITDAGHEIKTPLTIINANVDILEMETGENESLSDIRQQAKRLTALTNDLVYLARMEESEHTMPMVEFPVSETVRETAEPFRALAQSANKTWACDIQPMLTVKGNDNAIRQLVSILLDNALKYSPRDGNVAVRLFQQGHAVVLTVFNTTAVPIDPDTLGRVFDRFYRTDPSRNSMTGGHGIGLSIAKAIVNTHGGKITATSDDRHTFCVTVVLPQNGK